MTDPPIFVVGVARSGTTLLASLLSSHSRLDCGPESRFFARYRHLSPDQQRRTLDAARWPGPAVEFIDSLRNQGHPIVDLFDLSIGQIRAFLSDRPPSLAAMLESLTVLHAQRAGKARWVEKTPRHLLMTDTIRASWPDAYVVRIVRDPRDVALSLAGMPFAKASVVGNLVRIDHDDRASRERIAADPRAMTLRYEDLVSEPERELKRVCDFVDESFEASMLDRAGSATEVAAEHEWWKEAVAGPLETTRVGRWRTEMTPDVQRFAALHLAGFIEEHGYDGARQASGSMAVVPVADAVGPRNERLLVELAGRDTVVERPAPRTPMEMHHQARLVFVGARGQLDPGRDEGPLRRLVWLSLLAGGLLVRRLQRRPILWLRRPTLRPIRARDPVEWLLALLLRLLARRTSIESLTSSPNGPVGAGVSRR